MSTELGLFTEQEHVPNSQLQVFDYSAYGLTANDGNELDVMAMEISGFERSVVSGLWEIGKRLAVAQSKFGKQGAKDSGFTKWIETRTAYSRTQAYNIIGIYNKFPNLVPNSGRGLTKSVLIAIAQSPDQVRDHALELIENGEKVTLEDVKRLKREAQEASDKAKALEQEKVKLAEQKTLFEARSEEWRQQFINERNALREEKLKPKEVVVKETVEIEKPLTEYEEYRAAKEQLESLSQELDRLRRNQSTLINEGVRCKMASQQADVNNLEYKKQQLEKEVADYQSRLDRLNDGGVNAEMQRQEEAIESMNIELLRMSAELQTFKNYPQDDILNRWMELAKTLEDASIAITKTFDKENPTWKQSNLRLAVNNS